MSESETTRQLRLSSTLRGVIIAALVAVYSFVTDQPGASFTVALLAAAGLQLVLLLLRRFALPVLPALPPHATYLFELLMDAATVFLFALGVFGGLVRHGLDA